MAMWRKDFYCTRFVMQGCPLMQWWLSCVRASPLVRCSFMAQDADVTIEQSGQPGICA